MSNGHGYHPPPPPRVGPRRVDGRAFVVVGCLAVLAVWGSLMVAHRAWRGRYVARAAAGARLGGAVDPLAARVPTGVEPATWARAVGETHRVLVALAGAGLVDGEGRDALGRDVARRVAAADPSTSIFVLMRLWDDLERRGGPAIVQPPKASPLRLARAIGFLARKRPGDPAVGRTLAMAIDLAEATSGLDARAQESLRGRWAGLAEGTVDEALATIWADVEARSEAAATRARHARPRQSARPPTSEQAERSDLPI